MFRFWYLGFSTQQYFQSLRLTSFQHCPDSIRFFQIAHQSTLLYDLHIAVFDKPPHLPIRGLTCLAHQPPKFLVTVVALPSSAVPDHSKDCGKMDGLNYLDCHLLIPWRFPLPERVGIGPDYGFAGFRYVLNIAGFLLIPGLGTTITSMVTALVMLRLW